MKISHPTNEDIKSIFKTKLTNDAKELHQDVFDNFSNKIGQVILHLTGMNT